MVKPDYEEELKDIFEWVDLHKQEMENIKNEIMNSNLSEEMKCDALTCVNYALIKNLQTIMNNALKLEES